MKDRLVIVGAGGHGKVAADIASHTYREIVFLDDDPSLEDCTGFSVVGTSSDADKFLDGSEFFVAVGRASTRQRIQESLEQKGAVIATLIHPDAVIGRNVRVGIGTVIMAGTVINADTRIGKGCIINTCASVDHDNLIGNYAHISVGVHLAGTVAIGDRSWIGIGAVVSNNLVVTGDCVIGAGAVVVNHIQQSGTYVGIPARRVK